MHPAPPAFVQTARIPTRSPFPSENAACARRPRFRMALPSGPRIANLPSPASSPSPGAKKSAVFEAWLTENGMYLSPLATWGRAKHPLAIANETTDDGESSGRGLVAVKGIVQGEPLFEVPIAVILTKDRARVEIPQLPEDVNEYIAIASLLVRERARGDRSFWKPYFDVLPNDDDLIPLFRWSEEEMAPLKGSRCVAAAISLRGKLADEFAAAEATIFERRRDVFPEDVYTKHNWEWAFAVLFSRAIMLTAEQRIALVPYADLLNHNPFCSTYIDVQQKQFSDDRYVMLYTDRPYSKMDQVFVTYGPKPNADLLLLYGFISDRNPYDSVEIAVSLQDGDALFERKNKYLIESGVETTSTFPLYADRYPMELIEFLRFCVSNEDELDSADFGDFINEENETSVAEVLMEACRTALAAYPQTREEDDKLIADRGMYRLLPQKHRWAIRQRRAEKRILERTIVNILQEMSDPTFMFTETSG